MRYETLTIQTDTRGIAYVTLNRPEKRNVMSAQMIAELTDIAHSLGHDRSTRAIVLSGAGKSFCAGGDLEWMKAQIEADRATRRTEARKLAEMLQALNTMPTPLIGKIHGAALGGGVGLACVCDIAFADQDTKFGLTETRLGIIPATISPYVLARIGEGMARRIFMSSRIFDAATAQEVGLIAKAAPADQLDACIEAELTAYLNAAPQAVGTAKALARRLGMPITEALIDETINDLVTVWESEEAKEGIQAFLNKTTPPWVQSD